MREQAPELPLVCKSRWRRPARNDELFDARSGAELKGNLPMANRTKVTQQKRARERAKQERQQEKTRRREEAKSGKTRTARPADGEDPDIAGIVPGPQPSPWGDEEPLPAEPEEDGRRRGKARSNSAPTRDCARNTRRLADPVHADRSTGVGAYSGAPRLWPRRSRVEHAPPSGEARALGRRGVRRFDVR